MSKFVKLILCHINHSLPLVTTALLSGAAASLSSTLGPVTGGPPSTPNLNPPSQIDPSSIERGYAALGLTYQGNQTPAQTNQPNMPNQGLQGQAGVRPLNPMGERGFILGEFTLLKMFFLRSFKDLWLTENLFYRRKCNESQWRSRRHASKPTSQLAAGHIDAPECEQPQVGLMFCNYLWSQGTFLFFS